MRKTAAFILTLAAGLLLVSCVQPTVLSPSQTSLSFTDGGGTQTVILTANKAWTARTDHDWLRVSPASGEGNASLTVSCDGNTTYDSRTGTITFVSEELTQHLIVSQAEAPGLQVPQTAYALSSEAQTLSVDILANVPYTVEIAVACQSWIQPDATKGLPSQTRCFTVSQNTSYDGREGTITIRQSNGSLVAIVTVAQAPAYAIVADKTLFDLSYEAHVLDIHVKSNVDYEIRIDDSCKDWVSPIGTKGLTGSTVSLAVAENERAEREGKVVLQYGVVQAEITIHQASGIVLFEDANFKACCVRNFDKNGDGEISMAEADSVTHIDVHSERISSLAGIEHFQRLRSLSCYNNQLTSLDIRSNTALTFLDCGSNLLTRLDVSKNPALDTLYCGFNRLTMLNASKNPSLKYLACYSNQLTSLDVTRNAVLTHLDCSHNQLPLLDVSHNPALRKLYCFANPTLTEIWLKTAQTIADFQYDHDIAKVCYVE